MNISAFFPQASQKNRLRGRLVSRKIRSQERRLTMVKERKANQKPADGSETGGLEDPSGR